MSHILKEEQIGGQRLILGDCLKVMPELMWHHAVIADVPYEMTQARWDKVLPFEQMWSALRHVTAPHVPVCIFGMEPFSSALRMSNLPAFKYDWVWDKPKGTGFLNAKRQPMRSHEFISVFYERQCDYFPQKTKGHSHKISVRGGHLKSDVYGVQTGNSYQSSERYPRSVQTFSADTQNSNLHPTQKPVALLEYLVKTYTRPAETVLDFTMGSGTTLVACQRLGRNGTGIELDPDYFQIACERVEEATRQADLFIAPPKPAPIVQTDLLDGDAA